MCTLFFPNSSPRIHKSVRESTKSYAVVTGANKGIGLETVRQLASAGVKVVLTARNDSRGLEAVKKLKDLGLSDLVLFHQLDVADATSVASLANFIRARFGKLDILYIPLMETERRRNILELYIMQVNNAGTTGVIIDVDALSAIAYSNGGAVTRSQLKKTMTQTYELGEECLQVNYYGAKRTVEALLPLLRLSDSPTIVNVSSSMGSLQNISNERAKGILSDTENLTEEKIDEVLKEFLKNFKEGSLESKGWLKILSANAVSKAAMNAYTRFLAKRFPNFYINSVCPGFVKTDINHNSGTLTVEEGAASPVRLALLQNGGRSGLFYIRDQVSPF